MMTALTIFSSYPTLPPMTTPVRAAPAVTISAVTRDGQMRANPDGISEGGATDAPVSGVDTHVCSYRCVPSWYLG